MPSRRQQTYSLRAFAMSVGWILALLVGYWLIADWQAVPRLFATAFARVG
jgi:hypothetical protein